MINDHDGGLDLAENLLGGQAEWRSVRIPRRIGVRHGLAVCRHDRSTTLQADSTTNTCAAMSGAKTPPALESPPAVPALITRTPSPSATRVTPRPGCIPMFFSLS